MRIKKSPLEKELQKLIKQEQSFLQKHQKENDSKLNQLLSEKVPDKLQDTLDAAFAKAFTVVFTKGTNVIEKTYQKEQLEKHYDVNVYAAKQMNTSKQWKTFSKQSKGVANKNLMISGVSGVGLGLLGVGLPDIVLFTGMILRSVYEIALQYGFSYENETEKRFILLMIQGALSHGSELEAINHEIDQFIIYGTFSEEKEMDACIAEAADGMSKELLYMKFLQGIPLVGAVGGAYDAVYMKRINQYVQLKYRKRFLAKMKA